MNRFLILIFINLLTYSYSQCDNVEIREDKFEKTKSYYTDSPLTLNNAFDIKIQKNGINKMITITCHSPNHQRIGTNAGLHFLFTDGTTLKLYNNCLQASFDDPRESNHFGCLRILLFDSKNMEKQFQSLQKLKSKKIESIRVMDVDGRNWDYDLNPFDQGYFTNALGCMMDN